MGELGEDGAAVDDHPDASIDPALLEYLDQKDDKIPEELREEIARLRKEISSRRQLKPYHSQIAYKGPDKFERVRHRI